MIEELKKLDKDILIQLIANEAEINKEFKSKVETSLLANNPKKLATKISQRVGAISRGKKFIEYGESFSFASKLNSIVSDIKEFLVKETPKKATELLEKFLETDSNVFERCDDSSGSVGEVYNEALDIWVELAFNVYEKELFIKKAMEIYESDEYGAKSYTMQKVYPYLDKKDLEELLEIYISMFQKDKNNYKAKINALEIATHLNIPDRYKALMYEIYTKPTIGQIISIANEYYKVKNTKEVIKLLEDKNLTDDGMKLLISAYKDEKLDKKAINVAREYFNRDFTHTAFKLYYFALGEGNEKIIFDEVMKKIEKKDYLQSLLLLKEIATSEIIANFIISRADEALQSGNRYTTYRDIIEKIKDYPLAHTILCRAMLSGILDKGQSKYYNHASKDFFTIEKLSHLINDWQGVQKHSEYIQELKDKHFRKSAFWSRVEND